MVLTEIEIRKMITQYVDYLSKEIRINKVILFGSYAKGTAEENSDVDIAIESPDFSDDYLTEGERLHRSIWLSGVDHRIEPHPLHPVMMDFFREEILKTGKVMYEAPEYGDQARLN